jgi:hypothetical protein
MHKYITTALVLIALMAVYFYTQVDWDARAVRKCINQLIELVEKDGPVSKFEALGRSQKLPRYFTETTRVEYLPNRRLPADTDAIRGAFLTIWGEIESAKIRVIRHDVQINSDRTTAESQVHLRSSVIINGSDQTGGDTEYRIYWEKIAGDWRIREVIAIG